MHRTGSGVVRGGCQLEALESLLLLFEVEHAALDIVVQVREIDAKLLGGPRHQLHDAKGTLGAFSQLVEPAFLLGNRQRPGGIDFVGLGGFDDL